MIGKLEVEINGKTVVLPVLVNQDMLCPLLEPENKRVLTGWEAPEIGMIGYFENEYNDVEEFDVGENTLAFAKTLYENDNFFCTKETAENTVRADNVCRRLRHYAISHRAPGMTMADGGYTITYNYELERLEIGATGNWLGIGDVVFDTEEIAQQAMNKYASELTWYFTKGKTRM